MNFLQVLPVTGDSSAPIIYPDQAMDGATAGLIDLVDPWTWGGTLPETGKVMANSGLPIKNYPLAEDGWDETGGSFPTAGVTFKAGGGLTCTRADRIALPPGFRPKQGDKKYGIIWWSKGAPDPAGVSVNSTWLAIRDAANASIMLVQPIYTNGVLTQVAVNGSGINAGAGWEQKPIDGTLHQFGIEIVLNGTSAVVNTYCDGQFVVSRSAANSSNGFAAGGSVVFGLQSGFNGGGFVGHLFRAIAQQLERNGSKSFAELVVQDYDLNRDRLVALG